MSFAAPSTYGLMLLNWLQTDGDQVDVRITKIANLSQPSAAE